MEKNGNMNICMISSFAIPTPPLSYGGLEQVVWDLVEGLNELGHEVFLIAAEGSRHPAKGELMEIPGSNIDAGAIEPQAYKYYKSLLKDFDIIHDHSWKKFSYMARASNPKLRVISTLHGMCPYESAPPVPHCNFVGISKSHAIQMSATLKIPVYYVYNGINLEKYPYLEGRGERLLFLGRMSVFKGAHIFIEVCKRSGIPGDLVGDDRLVEDKNYVLSLKQACKESNGLVKYRGDTPRDECSKLFRHAKAFINPLLPPWSEPFGLVNIEAMASGTPVIGMRNGALNELILHGKTGFLCQSIDEMVDAIKKVDKIKSSACRKRAEYFSRRRMAEAYLELYNRILEGKEW